MKLKGCGLRTIPAALLTLTGTVARSPRPHPEAHGSGPKPVSTKLSTKPDNPRRLPKPGNKLTNNLVPRPKGYTMDPNPKTGSSTQGWQESEQPSCRSDGGWLPGFCRPKGVGRRELKSHERLGLGVRGLGLRILRSGMGVLLDGLSA